MPQLNDTNSFYRAMIPDVDEFPRTGRSARMLGIRVSGSIPDIPVDAQGLVKPDTGGMSVAPNSTWNIPTHRRPRGMGNGSSGNTRDRVFALADEAVPVDKLKVRPDPQYPQTHAFIEPAAVIELEAYEKNLSATRKDWAEQVWP